MATQPRYPSFTTGAAANCGVRQPVPAITEEEDLVCSRQAARRLVQVLAGNPEELAGDDNPFYIFSAEKRRVRIRKVRI